MLIIALTGGIGSGKTTVSEIFKSKNIPIIDTDVIARQIVELDKPAYNKIIKLFGENILDKGKSIDRQTLRKIIFTSEHKRLQLERILHPIIWNEVESELKKLKSFSEIPPYCIIVVPLLIENLTKNKPVTFDRILVVDIEEKIQIERTINRDNCDESMVKNIIKTQVSRQKRIDAADDIILNVEDLNLLKNNVEKLHKKYLQLSK